MALQKRKINGIKNKHKIECTNEFPSSINWSLKEEQKLLYFAKNKKGINS